MSEKEVALPAIRAVMSFPSHSSAKLRSLQREDVVLVEVLGFWVRKTFPSGEALRLLFKPALVLLHQSDRLVEKDGVVYHHVLMEGKRSYRYFSVMLCMTKY